MKAEGTNLKHDDAVSGIQHFERVHSLAERLSRLGIAIYDHRWQFLVFGSWVIIAGWRHRRFQFCWDGRDFFIDVSRSEHSSSGHSAHWVPVTNDRLPSGDSSAAIDYVESFFREGRDA